MKEEVWDVKDVLQAQFQLTKDATENLVQLIEVDECTVPFIARYRKELTNGMEADKLRQFIENLSELRDVQKKANTMLQNIEKQGKLDPKLEKSFKSAQTVDELTHLFVPYKAEKRNTLADRARSLGLDRPVLNLLSNPQVNHNFAEWIRTGTKGLSTLDEVRAGMKHLLADLIAKDPDTMAAMRNAFRHESIAIESKLSASKKKENEKAAQAKNGSTANSKRNPHKNDKDKYQLYYDFKCNVPSLKSHQILAINRGEAQKHLTVKVVLGKADEKYFNEWCERRWVKQLRYEKDKVLLREAIEDAFSRLIKPLVVRNVRSQLTRRAHCDAVQVFSRNLSKLLLTAPVRGKVVLGVDPGYKHGCKCAVVSANGDRVLATDVITLQRHMLNISEAKISKLYREHRFEIIAIGNGTACRETEQFFTEFISRTGSTDLVYCTVNEDGASIYSVTDEAKQEMPDLEPNLRSAVSIARRLQDPLVELVKIDPKHIGVGMYQHDVPATLMKAALDNVIEDCVTFVGVDLNVAGTSLLRHVAGLKATQAKNVVEWRNKNGSFVNRQQLLQVRGIGEKTFKQCAGFMRISKPEGYKPSEVGREGVKVEVAEPHPGRGKRKAKSVKTGVAKKAKAGVVCEPNPLDQTWIHPESYEVTDKLLRMLDVDVAMVGAKNFIRQVKLGVSGETLPGIASKLSVGEPTLRLIVDGLTQPEGYRDIRDETRTRPYRRSIMSIEHLQCGTTMQGRVVNVTDFGVFVDIGVGESGLLHVNDMNGRWYELREVLGPNDVITVTVKHKDLARKRIALRFVRADSLERTRFV